MPILERRAISSHNFCLDGFPFFLYCNNIFVRREAAKIDFGEDAVLDLPGGDPNNPMVIDEDDSISETDNEGMAAAGVGDPIGGPLVAGGLGRPIPPIFWWRR
ncbi:hypothetical protein PHJA_002696600 [Phtheirospermum japonicum]|uniref:Uncharacterized protein n=1 Tax=Phtheirospermum japonicum TaxID=374723 RepID=A0A830DAC4_9LAMI|nr:hypothetical protein PHJA_002696600 [Phtheirospermum japonicum]